jgi:N-acetylmuramoyl-L-alanine amidase
VASYRPATSVASNAVIHQVSAGETLSEIAEQYGVSLSSLRRLNKLNGDRIRVGAKLEIPGSTLAASGS